MCAVPAASCTTAESLKFARLEHALIHICHPVLRFREEARSHPDTVLSCSGIAGAEVCVLWSQGCPRRLGLSNKRCGEAQGRAVSDGRASCLGRGINETMNRAMVRGKPRRLSYCLLPSVIGPGQEHPTRTSRAQPARGSSLERETMTSFDPQGSGFTQGPACDRAFHHEALSEMKSSLRDSEEGSFLRIRKRTFATNSLPTSCQPTMDSITVQLSVSPAIAPTREASAS
jgi:hypothetical protein